ncbi:MAG TPA: PIN domain-containing protein [Bryobacteraceae bacterium]|jgi:predicted nucleic acid-binding protein|nr:PIN domain-containing protein [Bryobacteraceae bacterium]
MSAEGLLAAHAVTTIYDLVSKARDSVHARRTIAKLLQVFRVAPVDHGVLERALTLRGADFEDCVTAAAAGSAGCHWIVTRDPKGFRYSGVRALTPEVAAQLIDRAEQ